MDAISTVPLPVNEPNLGYAPGSAERAELEVRLVELQKDPVDLTATIGGEHRPGKELRVVQPHNHQHLLGVVPHRRGGRCRSTAGRRS